MTRVAAVDCGTNSIRLLVTDVTGRHKVDLHREMRIVRLGEGVDRTGRLGEAALERTRLALTDYAGVTRDLGVERVRMVATSATRDAGNRLMFSRMVQDVLGVEPEVVSGDEEAALSFDGATRDLPPELGPFVVADIGGGSTEVVLGGASVTAAVSVDVGCVRLTERHLTADPPTREQVEAARTDVHRALDRVAAAVPVHEARTFVGLAGSVTTVAGIALGAPEYDRDRIHGARVPAAQVSRVCGELLAMTRAERAALPVMHPGRVDVIAAGALILAALMERFDLTEVLVSEADILDGIAWSATKESAR